MPARRRFTPVRPIALLVLFGLLSGLCLSPAAATLATFGPLATLGPLAPTARTANAQAAPELVVPLHGTALTYRTVPQTAVNAELVGADGVKKDEGLGVAGADGVATVQFLLGGGVIQPGDALTLSRSGGKPLRVTVPALAAAVDVANDRVFGTAPAGSQLALSIATGGAGAATIERSATADAGGAFALALSGEVDLQAGAVAGTVSLTTAENHRFVTQFASLGAQMTLGAYAIRGQAPAGALVSAEILRADGTTQTIPPTRVTGGTAFVLSVLGQGAPSAPPQPLAAGQVITIRTTGGPAGSDETRTATLAALTVALDPAADAVSGTGPAATMLTLNADDMDGRSGSYGATTDGAGAYALPLSGQLDLGAGWRVRASYEAAPGARVVAVAVVRKVRAAVGFLAGQGRAEPGQAVTVTLRSSAGTVKTQQRTFVNDQGQYNLFGGGGFGPAPTPGDSIEIAFVDGDPDVLRVPTLTARTDVTADTVSGEAPAGAAVRVRVETAAGAPSFTAVSNASGMYQAATAPSVDLARPANGTVFVSVSEGAEFYTTFAAVQLTVNGGNTFQSNFIIGNGPLGRAVAAELYTPDSKLIGRASGVVFGGNGLFIGPVSGAQPQFFLQLTDSTGTPITMQPGDTLKFTAGDDAFDLVIPPLDAVVFVQTDTINGHTLPGNKVTLQIAGDQSGGIAATADATADAAGNFSHSFAGTWDVKYGDFVLLSTNIGGHLVLNTTIAPGMLIDADQALVLASLSPGVRATVTLKRGGRTLNDEQTTADASGALAVAFTDSAGAPVVLQMGDVLTVTPGDPNVAPLTITLPDLTVRATVATDAIQGRATTGGSLTMLALDAYGRSGSIGFFQAWPAVEANGTYAADFVPRVDVRPGTRVIALYRPAAGHYVVRSHTVPILNAEHSGPNACGFGDVRNDVTVDLVDAGSRTLAGAKEKARYDGFFSAVLRDTAGAAIASAAGQTDKARLGAAAADVVLPTLDLQVDWRTRQVRGTGPASTTFFVQPAVPCAAQAPAGILNVNVQFAFPQQTGADGALQTNIPGNLGAPGTGLEIGLYAPNDHRIFRHVYRALAQVHIHTDRVAGRANPLDDVTVIVKAADGTERGRGTGKADESGQFDVRVKDAAGGAVTMNAGDTVTLQAPAESPVVPVEPLSFDWSPGATDLVGNAPAGRTVQVVLRLRSGAVYAIARTADSTGAFRFGAADVPPRAGWAMGDVAAVRIVLPTADGHQIIDQTADFETPDGPGPGERDGRTLYLPLGYSNRRGGLAALDADGAVHVATPIVRARAVDSAEVPRMWQNFGGMIGHRRPDAAGEWWFAGRMDAVGAAVETPFEARIER